MSISREERERDLWKLARSSAGMLELVRLHEVETGQETGIQADGQTADVGPMIVRILDREFAEPAAPSTGRG